VRQRLLVVTPFALAAALGAFHVGTAQAAKAISVQIKDGERVVLRGVYSADDRAETAAVWRDLEDADLEALVEFPSEPSTPRQATLEGKLHLVISWHEPLASAQINELRLVRDSATSARWRLAPGEVARTAPLAGLQLPSRMLVVWPLVAGVAVCVVAGVACWWLRRR
jgi:hypothetical protein